MKYLIKKVGNKKLKNTITDTLIKYWRTRKIKFR